MKVYSTDAIRNIGILGHVKCGKTSIAKVLNKGCLGCGDLQNLERLSEWICEKCESKIYWASYEKRGGKSELCYDFSNLNE